MRSIKLNPYIALGTSVRFLLDLREGLPIRLKANKELPVLDHMILVNTLLAEMGLKVTRQAYMSELGATQRKFEKLPDNSDAKLSQQDVTRLVERIGIVSSVLKYEAVSLQAYLIAEKRLPVEKLLSNISGLFGDSVFQALPDLTQYDFTQAGKCIAFEVPTAAAFHILRGTEGVLRSYNSLLLPNASAGPLLWGPMVTELRKITDDPPTKELLDNLDNIRVSFRNPTQHPEKVYDLDDVQDLFNICVDVINRMAKDLFRRKIWSEEENIPF